MAVRFKFNLYISISYLHIVVAKACCPSVATICIGNTKETVRQDMTEHLEIAGREGEKHLPTMPDDDVIVTRADAVSGVDLWCDPKIVNAWFMSDRLAQALIAAGLKDAFELVRTKTV